LDDLEGSVDAGGFDKVVHEGIVALMEMDSVESK
jgi:hypothetical protein